MEFIQLWKNKTIRTKWWQVYLGLIMDDKQKTTESSQSLQSEKEKES